MIAPTLIEKNQNESNGSTEIGYKFKLLEVSGIKHVANMSHCPMFWSSNKIVVHNNFSFQDIYFYELQSKNSRVFTVKGVPMCNCVIYIYRNVTYSSKMYEFISLL